MEAKAVAEAVRANQRASPAVLALECRAVSGCEGCSTATGAEGSWVTRGLGVSDCGVIESSCEMASETPEATSCSRALAPSVAMSPTLM